MTGGERRGRRKQAEASKTTERAVNYRHLVNPFEPVGLYSDDQIEAIHQTALRVLQELGVKILLPAARTMLREGGVDVNEASHMARFDPGIITQVIETMPSTFTLRGADEATSQIWGGRSVTWCPAGGMASYLGS